MIALSVVVKGGNSLRKFLIASHGRLASGMASSLQILLGSDEGVTVLDAYLDASRVEDHVEAFYRSENQEDQVILLSDLVGGSVNQVLYRYLDRPHTFLVAGVNLALVLELVAQKEEPITRQQLLETIEMSRQAITLVEDDQVEPQEEEFF